MPGLTLAERASSPDPILAVPMESSPASSAVARLLAAAEDLDNAVEARSTSGRDAAPGVDEAVRTVEHLRGSGLQRLPDELVWPLTRDLELLCATLRGPSNLSSTQVQLACILRDRIVQTAGQLALLLQRESNQDDRVGDEAAPTEAPAVLMKLAEEHGRDARFERKVMLGLYALTFILALVAGGVASVGATLARQRHGVQYSFDSSVFAAYGGIALGVLVVAALSLREARRHLVVAQEATRLQRQLAAIDAYLKPMAPAMRDLVRGALAQRIFAGLPGDEEPWQAPVWPDSDALLRATDVGRDFEDEEPAD
jgi:hypothetical protein